MMIVEKRLMKLTFGAVISFETAFTMALAFDATTVSRAARHLTFACWDFAFSTFETFLTVTQSTAVVTMAGAQHWTYA